MSLTRLWPVARKEFLEIWRDPRALAFVLVMPVLMILLYGYGIRTDITHVATAVWDLDRTQESRDFLGRFSNSGSFDLDYPLGNLLELRRLLDVGRVKVGIVIAHDFARHLQAGEPAEVQFVVDGSDANTSSIAMGEISAILDAYGKEQVEKTFRGIDRDVLTPLELRQLVWYNPDLKSTNFIVPGLAATILTMLASILTALTVAREWERGTMEALIASPLRPIELMVGKVIPYVFIGFVDVGLIIAVATLWFGVPMRGSLGLLLAGSGIFLVGALGVGLYISVITRSQQAALQLSILASFLPTLVLSGFIFPIEQMPWPLRAISTVIPARYFLLIIRGIFLKGVGVAELWPNFLFLVLFAMLILVVSAMRFQKRLGP